MDGWDFTEEAGPSTINEKFSNGSTRMEFDDDVDFGYSDSEDEVDCALQELDKSFLKGFCKKALITIF